ncbi:ciliary-associated calcium-binding coiled-coil protein 1 isoform X2 [Esox lucius]|uniref:ciliary-associated calcium-binding coiled-coil protein 1 isoform X2 n=1 Tax=Esox lucius TaxID=8010 RepID=UPI0014775AC6|nr:ciliary-associated calcium-binding coiled-coil protein 1 isoform X2 [Esox lucius]
MSGRVKQSTSKSADKSANDTKDEAKDNDAERDKLYWKKMSHDQINTLLDLTVEQVQLQFEEILDFGNHRTCLKEAALLDYFVHGFWWAKEMNFTCQQISCIMAVLQLLLDNLSEKQIPFGDNLNEFAKFIARMRQSPPEVDPLFDVEQATSIADYLTFSLFQNYRLYEFLFTQPREELLLGKERTIEVLRSTDLVAPLEEGMSTDVYLRYMAPVAVGEHEERSRQEEEPEEDVAGRTENQEKEQAEFEGYTVEDVKLVMEDLTKEMLGNLQAEFTEKLRIQETYSARLEQLKHNASK